MVRAGVAQVLVIRQIAWMAVCVPGRARCQCAGACQGASVPGACRAAPDRWIELITLRRACEREDRNEAGTRLLQPLALKEQ